MLVYCHMPKEFLSTPSARRATDLFLTNKPLAIISIHALREEGDLKLTLYGDPRTKFLSTPSARRATLCFCTLRL